MCPILFHRLAIVVLVAMIMLVPSACTSPQGSREAALPRAFTERDETIVVREGEMFHVRLDANPTTGYSWTLADQDEPRLIKKIEHEYVAESTGRVGSGGTEVWTLIAHGTGETRLLFRYRRAWESEVPAAREVAFRVRVHG